MSSPPDGKLIVNTAYHGAVVASLAIGYNMLTRRALGGAPPKLDFNPRDVGMLTVDVALAMATRDLLIKQGLIPGDIMK